MIVILVFALVSILSVGIYNRQSLFVQSSGNVFAQAQAYQYALGSEIYGRRLLKADWDDDKEKGEFVDDLEQTRSSIVLPVEDALLEAQFNDVHGKLNINDVVDMQGVVIPLMEQRLKRLLNRLAINTLKVESLQDWIDENQDPTNYAGFEDYDYLGGDVPYHTGAQPFYDVSELLLIKDFDRKDYEKLLPHISVLPQGQAPINVNTASAEVLQSIVEGLSDQEAEALVARRDDKRWKDVAEFKSEPELNGKNFDAHYLSVQSSFFEIATQITLADRKVRLLSLVYRDSSDGTMHVIKRDQGQKYLITKDVMKL